MRAVCDFYEIAERGDGLVDVVLTPGEVVPMLDDLTGRTDYGIRLMAVRGINPEDPQWQGNLEEHIRRHYAAWLESAEEIEI
jgi:hypothetical protein